MLLDPPPHFSPSGKWVAGLRATLPLPAAEDGSRVLPIVIRWAYLLNEGDLLAVSPGLMDNSCRFESYAERARSTAEAFVYPWPWMEELLRMPMAAVGPKGALRLPEEAQALLAGGQVLLCVKFHRPWEYQFILQRVDGRRIEPELSLEAQYRLPVLPGFQARLPEDALWALSLAAGDRLACQQRLGMAFFEPWQRVEPPAGRSVVELGPGGLLSLPDSLRVPWILKPDSSVQLKVCLEGTPSTRATFQVRPWVALE